MAKRERWNIEERQQNFQQIYNGYDCTFCLEEFQLNDSVITLKCNDAHVFHRNCFSKYIKCQKEQDDNERKCPMCQV